MRRVAALGCIVCGQGAVAHHIRYLGAGGGIGLKCSDFETIPLCPMHHTDGGYGVAFHAGPAEWEKNFGRQIDLLAETQKLLAVK